MPDRVLARMMLRELVTEEKQKGRRVLEVLEKRGVEFIENGVRLTRRPRR